MDDKMVDGIKKLNKEEILKSREAVLNAIRSVEEKKYDDKKPAKLVDSIIKKKEAVVSPDFKSKVDEPDAAYSQPTIPEPEYKAGGEQAREVEKIIDQENIQKQRIIKEREKAAREQRRVEAEKRQAEEKLIEQKKKIAEQAKKRTEKAVKEQERIKEEKRRDEEKKQIEEQRKIDKQNEKQAEKDREEKQRYLKEQKKKQKEEVKLKNKIKKQERKQKARIAIKGLKSNLKKFTAKAIKIFFSILLVSVVVAVLFYAIFAVILLKFNLDNSWTRKLGEYVNVPAVITKIGLVDYFTYFDEAEKLKQTISNKNNYITQLQKNIACIILKNQLIVKYGLNSSENSSLLNEELSRAIIKDKDINQVGINRIEKIKEMINDGNNFIEVSTKFGDILEKIDFSAQADVKQRFGNEAASLAIGGISDIIILEDGYYILRRYEKAGGLFAFSYVFISAVTLDDYLAKEANNLKMWSLVDLK